MRNMMLLATACLALAGCDGDKKATTQASASQEVKKTVTVKPMPKPDPCGPSGPDYANVKHFGDCKLKGNGETLHTLDPSISVSN